MTSLLQPALILRWLRVGLLGSLWLAMPLFAAEYVYQLPDQFVSEVFGGETPKPRTLWLAKDINEQASKILGHAPPRLRQRYWADAQQSVWILEEIGKEEPITVGFVVKAGRISQARVLIYRESRGGEIRYPAFIKQYQGAGLTEDRRLDRNIDGISGATLSVRAMERMARLALYLDKVSREEQS